MSEVKEVVAEWKSKSIQEQKEFCILLRRQIQKLDKLPFDAINLTHRNELVEIKRKIQCDLPFDYQLYDKVIVKFDRPIKGIVKELISREDRTILIKPIDNLYKDEFIISECSLSLDVAPAVKEGQILLF
ncbi:hypothetical protein LAV82_23710 [Bacillus sp. ILBB4]|nr:hypothetical protein [Bacillus sp. ILBB4]